MREPPKLRYLGSPQMATETGTTENIPVWKPSMNFALHRFTKKSSSGQTGFVKSIALVSLLTSTCVPTRNDEVVSVNEA